VDNGHRKLKDEWKRERVSLSEKVGTAVDRGRFGHTMGMKGVRTVQQKQVTDKISIYIPQSKMAQKPVERLMALSKKKDRSVNYLVVEAILEYLEREGGKR
jgi:hypothetical protein